MGSLCFSPRSTLVYFLFFCSPTHNESQSQRILNYPLDQSTSHRCVSPSQSRFANTLSSSLLSFTGAMMQKERRRTAAEHVRHVSHFITNYHKRGGLTVISAMTFQNAQRWDGEAREKEGERRVNGFLSVIHEE